MALTDILEQIKKDTDEKLKALEAAHAKKVASIESGLLILLGIINDDTQEDIKWLSNKIVNLRIFGDENEVMNKSLRNSKGEAIVVSQFTLHASTKKVNGCLEKLTSPLLPRSTKPNSLATSIKDSVSL